MKIKPQDVRYLIFEGGGGKGATYLGALQALEELEIINYKKHKVNNQSVYRLDNKQIKGLAGTSVGSLTALLIAMGYTSEEIENFLLTNLTDQFLDSVEFGLIPTIYTSQHPECAIEDPRLKEGAEFAQEEWNQFIDQEDKSLKSKLKIPLKFLRERPQHVFVLLFKWYLYNEAKKESKKKEDDLTFLPTPADLARSKTLKNAVDKILNNPTDSFNSLKHEFGFFLGKGLRDTIDHLIEMKSGIKNCTFQQFQKEFGVDLVICTFDMYTKRVEYLRNNKRWGKLCVADAVRMSVSIPFVFKPVFMHFINGNIASLTDNIQDFHYFVDGGVANNFPIHVFDKPSRSRLNPNTIGFVLSYNRQINPFSEETSLFEYLEDVFMTILKQTTMLQIKHQSEMDQVIELDPGNLKVLDFSFDKAPTKIIAKAKEEVLTYFE
ncbi:MAG: patatin-like phospholipase family protein [Candidatus Heimdallarchaeaceae archaeon]